MDKKEYQVLADKVIGMLMNNGADMKSNNPPQVATV